FGCETSVLTGLENCGWLNTLKNSARNCRVADSRRPPMRVVLNSAVSKLNCRGPRKMPIPELPNTVPSPRVGMVVNALPLIKPGPAAQAAEARFPPAASGRARISRSRRHLRARHHVGKRRLAAAAEDGAAARIHYRQRLAALQHGHAR